MAIVRLGDFKRIQQAAMRINKNFKNYKYNLWVIVSVYMQAIDRKGNIKNVLLPLAEKMIEKAVRENLVNDFECKPK